MRGHAMSVHVPEQSYPKPDAFFPGRAYLLIDNGSFSMSAGFAAMFRDYKVGTILGSETGGTPSTFGGPHHFTLKNSHIPSNVAWTENFDAHPVPGDDQHGVLPAIPITLEKLAPFKTAHDPTLAFTLHYVQSGID